MNSRSNWLHASSSSFSYTVCSDLTPTPFPFSLAYSPLSLVTVWHAIVALRALKVIVLLANMHQMGNISTLHGFFWGRNLVATGQHHQWQHHHRHRHRAKSKACRLITSAANWGRHRRGISITLRRRHQIPLATLLLIEASQLRRLLIGNTLGFRTVEEKEGHTSHTQVEEPTAKLLFLSFHPFLVCLSLREQTNLDNSNV